MRKLTLLILLLALIIGTTAAVYAVSRLYVQDGMLVFHLEGGNTTRTSTTPITLFFDDFNGDHLQSDWLVEYSNDTIITYIPFVPPADHYTVQARVQASQLSHFALLVSANDLPLIDGLPFEVEMGNSFTCFWRALKQEMYPDLNATPELNTWYILEVKVSGNPYQYTYSVYSDDGSLLGTCQTGTIDDAYGNIVPNVTNGVAYSRVCWVGMRSWGSQSTYSVDWIKITRD